MIALFKDILDYQFLRNALVAAFLVSIVAGIIGTYITSRRLVFLSGGITHASFGGIGIAYYLGVNPIFGAIVFSILSAFGIEALSHRKSMREDSAIGILWAFGMAVGIIFIFLTPGYAPNLLSFLFGSILTVTNTDLLSLLVLNVAVICFFIIFYKPILYIAFDQEFARTQKIPVAFFNYILIAFIAIAIVLSIRVVGIILLISLFTIPPATANIFSNHFGRIIFWSILLSFLGCFMGLIISYGMNIPSGAAIVVVLVLLFGIVKVVVSSCNWFKRRSSMAQ
ncbi:MAG: metal ABC transporter permease [Bacteroidales bacterium]|nr:MAG: metal ABC transporter permease [Bacteroidales bacterium]